MKAALLTIRPLDTATNARVDVYVGDGTAEDLGAGGKPFGYEPAVVGAIEQTIELFTPVLDGKIQAGRIAFRINFGAITAVKDPDKLYWDGAPVLLTDDIGTVEFTGYIDDATPDNDGRLSITAIVSTQLLDKPLLTITFSGVGGLGGDPGLRGTYLPAGFGIQKNIEPVWFDQTYNIGMIDGYGNLVSVAWLGEGLSSFGPSVGDYATYATLKAAIVAKTVAPGRWATCIAQGLIGLGAPPAGRITCHATFGFGKVGTMIRRVLTTHAGIAAGLIDVAAFNAVDAALTTLLPNGGAVHYWTNGQRNVQDLVQALARSANASPIVTFQGLISITRAGFSAPLGVFDLTGAQLPRVITSKLATSEPPVYLMSARAARPATVLATSEVNYVDTIIDRGLYDGTVSYRQGNTVALSNSSEWLYINPVASTGNAPPPHPQTSNAYWQRLKPPATYNDGTPIEDLKPAQAGATLGARAGTNLLDSQGNPLTDNTIKNSFVPTGVNLMMNSSFARGAYGFITNAPGGVKMNLSGYFGKRQVAYVSLDTTFGGQTSGFYDVASLGYWISGSVDQMVRYAMPVQQGDLIAPRVLATSHRCNIELYCVVLDKAGNLLQAETTGQINTNGGGNDGDGFTTLQLITTITAVNAAYAQWMFRITANGQGGSQGPFAFFSEPWFGKLAPNQTVIPLYTPGPSDPLADVTIDAQIDIGEILPITYAADSNGNVPNDAKFASRAVQVTRGGVSIRSDPSVTYSLSNVSPSLTGSKGNLSISNANADRGTIYLSQFSGSGGADVTVSVNGKALLPARRLTVTVVNGPPPSNPGTGEGGGAGSNVSANASGKLAPGAGDIIELAKFTNIAVPTGKTVTGTAALAYNVAGNTTANQTLRAKWQFTPAGGTTWTDFAAFQSGNAASYYSDAGEQYRYSGNLNFNQGLNPNAGSYDFRIVAAVVAAGAGLLLDNSPVTLGVSA